MMSCDVLSVFFNSNFNLLRNFPNVPNVTIITWYFVDYITSLFNFNCIIWLTKKILKSVLRFMNHNIIMP